MSTELEATALLQPEPADLTLAELANAGSAEPAEPAEPDERRGYTVDTTFFGLPSAPKNVIIQNVLGRPHGAYNNEQIADIIDSYWVYATSGALDPVPIIAHAVLASDNFSSFWAAVPQRNPGRFGVNGQVLPDEPASPADWAHNEAQGRWERGLTFSTWGDDAIPFHVGIIMAYILPPRTGSISQRIIAEQALDRLPIPREIRGKARTIGQLSAPGLATTAGLVGGAKALGRSWAATAQRLARGR